ncbi:hypothetical protein L596_027890 [Steinernema carpocapsae]|uniref:SAM domain-containing protein n=1 Tax=Steinernema carpocapsae TaxID=34508 RepID=A0A4U5LWT8_STECR|nr:hypothetical protein L596_027890 [Steinernema carpocapsae]
MASIGQWQNFFESCGIPSESCAKFARTFHSQRIQPDMIGEIDRETFAALGVTMIGDQVGIFFSSPSPVTPRNAAVTFRISLLLDANLRRPAECNSPPIVMTSTTFAFPKEKRRRPGRSFEGTKS